jgi:hypothetical protein
MKIEDGFLLKKEIKVKYIEPLICKCGRKYIPTKGSKNECLFCKRNIVNRAELMR